MLINRTVENARLVDDEIKEIKFEDVYFAYSEDSNLREKSAALADKQTLADKQKTALNSVTKSPVDQADAETKKLAPPKDVIQALNLTVEGGSVVALVGRSGAGKTTITDLVARFYDPRLGRITLNGHDLRDYQLDSYRELIGIVQQEVFLFDGTVFENIAYATRDATREQVIQAAKQANADEFIVDLEFGYDSIVGERGVKLSGGQRQRLAIARALLADPKILILDEATSNLDTESEQLIQKSMKTLLKNRTTFVIAHRLSTITDADLIVVVDDGRIVESGNHKTLVALNGHYARMVSRQANSIDGN